MLILAHIALSAAVLLQSPTPNVGTFGCGTKQDLQRTDFFEKPPLAFTPVNAPPENASWMHKKFAGLDAAKFGMSSVDFFVHPIPTEAYAGAWGGESKTTALELYIRIESPGSAPKWFLLENPKSELDRQGQSLLFMQQE